MGDIIAVVGFIGTMLLFMFRMEGKLNVLSAQRELESNLHTTKFESIEAQLGKLVDCTIQLAKQEEKINFLSEKLESIVDIVRPKTGKRQPRSKT